MYESNVRQQFALENGTVLTETLFGFPMVPDNTTITQDSLASGFDCGAPPEPPVSYGWLHITMATAIKLYSEYIYIYIHICDVICDSIWSASQGNVPPNPKTDTHSGPRHSKLAQAQIVSPITTYLPSHNDVLSLFLLRICFSGQVKSRTCVEARASAKPIRSVIQLSEWYNIHNSVSCKNTAYDVYHIGFSLSENWK